MLGDDDDSPTARLLLGHAGTRAPAGAPDMADVDGISRRGAHSAPASDYFASDYFAHSCIDGAEMVEIFEAFCEEAEEEGRGGGGGR